MKKHTERKILTPLELKVMNVLWTLKKAFVKDVIEAWPEAEKPKYNTVSTIIRILENDKDYIGHEVHGRSYRYFPLVSRAQYQKMHIKNVLKNVFAGSMDGLVSTLINDETVSNQELDSLRKLLDDHQES
ncbi:MAG: BlaI/MecI/CopY family transcriptional regulator [Bacteroidota bacterium]